MVGEYLREFCDRHARTPRRDEQAAIAAEQTRRIDAAAAQHAIVIADTTALMIAVYSDQVFGDRSLYADAEHAQRRCDATLLTALDLPWLADGLQRDGPHVREPVDAKVRAALARSGVAYSVIGGVGAMRLAAARAAVRTHARAEAGERSGCALALGLRALRRSRLRTASAAAGLNRRRAAAQRPRHDRDSAPLSRPRRAASTTTMITASTRLTSTSRRMRPSAAPAAGHSRAAAARRTSLNTAKRM